MNDDLELAALLGEAPRTPDPAFRFDVFARVAQRSRRRAARRRAGIYVAVSAAIGLAFPAAQAIGVTLAAAEPFLLAAAALGLSYTLAVLALDGPGALLTRSRHLLRARV
jgi:nitroreductase